MLVSCDLFRWRLVWMIWWVWCAVFRLSALQSVLVFCGFAGLSVLWFILCLFRCLDGWLAGSDFRFCLACYDSCGVGII